MEEQIVQLNPDKILVVAADNPRYGTKKLRVESLSENIKEVGAVLNPVEVAVLEGDKAHSHRLIVGYTRHAAVLALNAEGAGMTLPAIVREIPDELTQLKHQLAENMERENLSPMDQAVAIRKLLDAGVERKEIRRIFARPGGRKGLQRQPASNAYLNMTASFLDLPKAVQGKIHDGIVGVAAAYELTKVSPEKRQAVLDRAEADRIAQIDRDEKDEERYLKAEQKIEQMVKDEEDTAIKLSNAGLELKATKERVEQTTAAGTAAYQELKAAQTSKDEKRIKGATEAFQAAEVDSKSAAKLLNAAEKALDKLKGKKQSVSKATQDAKERLENARKAATTAKKVPGNKKPITPGDVKNAAAKEGAAPEGTVPLKLADIRKFVEDLCLPGTYKMVTEVGLVLKKHFDGISTPKEAYNQLATITGEKAAAARSADMPKVKK